MRLIKAFVLLAVICIAAGGTLSASAVATSREMSSGNASFTGHVVINGASTEQLFDIGIGILACDGLVGEATIENEDAGEGVESHIGRIDSLGFTDSTHDPTSECDSPMVGATECDYNFLNLPYEVRAIPVAGSTTTTVHVRSLNGPDVRLEWICESPTGTSSHCMYSTNLLSGSMVLNLHRVVFDKQVLTRVGFLFCEPSLKYSGTWGLKTEAGAEVMLR
jgi:hypothetical protein